MCCIVVLMTCVRCWVCSTSVLYILHSSMFLIINSFVWSIIHHIAVHMQNFYLEDFSLCYYVQSIVNTRKGAAVSTRACHSGHPYPRTQGAVSLLKGTSVVTCWLLESNPQSSDHNTITLYAAGITYSLSNWRLRALYIYNHLYDSIYIIILL